MSRNDLSWDDASTAARVKGASTGTHARIFGNSPDNKPKKVFNKVSKKADEKVLDWHEEEALLKKAAHLHEKRSPPKRVEHFSPTKKLSSAEIDMILDEELAKSMAKQASVNTEQPLSAPRQGIDQITHSIRYSSFMDKDYSNTNKLRDQKLQQKQWLDEQMAERKLIESKKKISEIQQEQSNFLYDARSASQQDRHKIEKHEMQQQIRDYNEAMAKQKRAKDQMTKEDDKQNAFNYQKPSKFAEARRMQLESEVNSEMMEKERALSQNMRQMNTQNQN